MLGLADALQTSLCLDPTLAAALHGEIAARNDVGTAKSAYLPTLSLSTGTGPSQTSTTGVHLNGTESTVTGTLSYVLFDFGARSAKTAVAKENAAIAHMASVDTYQQVILNTASAYYAVRAQRLQLDSANEAQKAAEEALTVAREKHKVGVVARSDVLQAQTSLAQARLAVVQAETALRDAKAQLNSQIGQPLDSKVTVEPEDMAGVAKATLFPLDDLLNRAAQSRSDIQEARATVEAGKAQVAAVRAQYLPTLSVVAQSGYSRIPGSAATHLSSAMVQLSIPIFSGFAKGYATASAQESERAAEEKLKSVQRSAALDVFTQRSTLLNAQEALVAANAYVQSANENREVALKQYKAGVGTMVDLLNANASLAQARLQVAQAYQALDVARLSVARAIGQLSLDSI